MEYYYAGLSAFYNAIYSFDILLRMDIARIKLILTRLPCQIKTYCVLGDKTLILFSFFDHIALAEPGLTHIYLLSYQRNFFTVDRSIFLFSTWICFAVPNLECSLKHPFAEPFVLNTLGIMLDLKECKQDLA